MPRHRRPGVDDEFLGPQDDFPDPGALPRPQFPNPLEGDKRWLKPPKGGVAPDQPLPTGPQFPPEVPPSPAAPAEPPPAPTGLGPERFTGFDLGKQYRPSSAKGAFLRLAQGAPRAPQGKPDAEAWFNEFIKKGLEDLGFKVHGVRGDTAQIEVAPGVVHSVDFLRGASGGDNTLQWLVNELSGGGGGRSASPGPNPFLPSSFSFPTLPASSMFSDFDALMDWLRRQGLVNG